MQHALTATLSGITQEGFGDRRISSMGMVIGLHVLVAVMLFTGIARTPREAPPKPIDLFIVPDTPPPPVVKPVIKPDRPITARHIDLPNPPIDEPPIDTTPPARDAVPLGDTTPRGNEIIATDRSGSHDKPFSGEPPAIGLVCPNVKTVQAGMRYPPAALRDGVAGEVMVRFVLTSSGGVRDARVVSATPGVLNRAALAAVRELQCVGQSADITVDAPFLFRLTE